MNKELIAFAEEVRRRCIDIMTAADDDGTDPFTGAIGAAEVPGKQPTAYALAAELCELAATVANQEQMKHEAAGEDRYDLATLGVRE